MLVDFLKEINEGRSEKGRGSKKGREKFTSEKGGSGRTVKARKSRVKVYDTIDAALKSGASYGTIFSTKAADRLYVISKPTWGEKSRSGGNTRIAKGFTPGSATPSASWPSIKAHAVRTGLKHGKSKSKRLTKVYGSGKPKEEEKRYAGKKDKVKEATAMSLEKAPEKEKERREKRRLKLKNPSEDARISRILSASSKGKPQFSVSRLSIRNKSRLSKLAASTDYEGPFLSEEGERRLLGGISKKGLSAKDIAAQNLMAYKRLIAALRARKEQKPKKLRGFA